MIFPLKRGVTRVGLEAPFGDFEVTRTQPIEARQWLVVQPREQFWIMDDHSTNLSLVLPRELPQVLDADDPRWSGDRYDYMKPREKALEGVSLDWASTVVHELREGEVLLIIYAALVFGGVQVGA